MSSKELKRFVDVVGALVALVVFAPVMLVIAFAVRVKMGSPVLFEQARPGLGGQIFALRKFRTMTDERDESGELLPGDRRVTKFGNFLRSSSLDELPELFNVLRGEMSLVGPRPLLPRYMPYYTERELRRFEMRPGITGLSQVSGRNRLPWDERLELDVRYVEQYSPLLDAKILARTVVKVLSRSDVDLGAEVLMDVGREARREARQPYPTRESVGPAVLPPDGAPEFRDGTGPTAG